MQSLSLKGGSIVFSCVFEVWYNSATPQYCSLCIQMWSPRSSKNFFPCDLHIGFLMMASLHINPPILPVPVSTWSFPQECFCASESHRYEKNQKKKKKFLWFTALFALLPPPLSILSVARSATAPVWQILKWICIIIINSSKLTLKSLSSRQ